MKKVILLIVAVAMLVALPLSSVLAYEAFIGPTEVVQYDADKAYNGYTLFSPFNQLDPWYTYLIDMEGNRIHTWQRPYGMGLHARLLENGNLIRGGRPQVANDADTYKVLSFGGVGGVVDILDWDSNLVDQIAYYSADYRQHHDFRKIHNPTLGEDTYMLMVSNRKTKEDCEAIGGVTDYLKADNDMWSVDGIVELTATSPHKVIWKWCFYEHTCQSEDPGKSNYRADISAHPEKFAVNWEIPNKNRGPSVDWLHCNSFDYNEALDQIVINAKNMSTIVVIDHGGTFVENELVPGTEAAKPAGDFLYRFGNPSYYDRGAAPGYMDTGEQQLWGSHNIQWIRPVAYTGGPALPGAGNFTIMDNGCYTPMGFHSKIFEWNGFLDADGVSQYPNYVDPPAAGYFDERGRGAKTNISNQVVWSYRSVLLNSFYGAYISGTQRLPNGNTFICSGPTGHLFEVTPGEKSATTNMWGGREVVWEYNSPVARGIHTTQTDANSGLFAIFRALRYGPDYPGLAGKTLTPQGTLTGRIPGTVDVYPPVVPITGWGIPPGTSSEGGAGAGGGGGGGGGGY